MIAPIRVTNLNYNVMDEYERRIREREEQREQRKRTNRRRTQIWLVVGVVVLIVLLFFWVDLADIMGWGDGAA